MKKKGKQGRCMLRTSGGQPSRLQLKCKLKCLMFICESETTLISLSKSYLRLQNKGAQEVEPKSHHKGLKIRFYQLPWGFYLFISLFLFYLPETED